MHTSICTCTCGLHVLTCRHRRRCPVSLEPGAARPAPATSEGEYHSPGNDHHSHNHCKTNTWSCTIICLHSINTLEGSSGVSKSKFSRSWVLNLTWTNVISSSGPRRKVAPFALACLIPMSSGSIYMQEKKSNLSKINVYQQINVY